MAAKTGNKKLDGNGLGIVWGRIKTLYNNLVGVVEENRIKHLGGVETLSLTGTFEKNTIISCANVYYLSSAKVTGLPTNIVTEDNVMVLDDGEVVVDGDNTESKWVYVCGQVIDRTPQSDSNGLVKSGGVYSALQEKADKDALKDYVNDCRYNSTTVAIELLHDEKVICAFSALGFIGEALKPIIDRLDVIESRYVYDE